MEPGTTIAQYEVVERIGAGGMGEVYLAHDSRLGRDVAIKSVPQGDDKALARFRREARILASLSHPNIAAIHGLEEQDGRPFLIMEYVPGKTLAERIAAGKVPASEVLSIGLQVAAAMAAAHEHGVIHRDLKPANVIVRPDGTCKVLDFGLARAELAEGQQPATQGLTSAGTILGTAPYMSPEQVRGLEVDGRSDIWALGVLLYELLSGTNPFHGRTSADTISAILNVHPDPAALPDDLPATALELVGRCLVKDADQRVADFRHVERLLKGEAGSEPSKPATAWSRTPSPAGRSPGGMPASGSRSGAVLRTLVVSDLVGSTSLVERLGDQRAARVMAQHDKVARELLPAREGREIDKTDGFLLLFERPIEGVLYALDYHRALKRLSAEEDVVLEARVGIHLGEVILRPNSAEAVSMGAKPIEVEGLAKPTAARLMSAGMPRQTLLTRGAYDLALRGSVGEPDAQGLQWLHHGPYVFQGVDAPVEVFEVGQAEASPLAPPPDSGKVRRAMSGELSSTMSVSLPAPPPSRPTWMWGAAAAVALALIVGAFVWSRDTTGPGQTLEAPAELHQIQSIVALPSDVHGSDDDLHLGEAVSRSLSSRLAKLPELVVKAPPSAASLDGGTAPASVAAAYAVDAMVTSVIQVAGAELAIDVQIIATDTQDLLWSETFEGSRDGWLDLLRRVASGAGSAIQEARGDQKHVALDAAEPRADGAVELELRRAEFLWNRYNHQHRPEDFEAAKSAYEALWEADPTLVEVASNMGYLYMFHWEATGNPSDLELEKMWAERSRAVRPTGRGLALLAWEAFREDRPEDALDLTLQGAKLDPQDQFVLNTVGAVAGMYSNEVGAAAMAHVRSIHPLYLYPPVNEAGMLVELGRFEESLARLDTVLRLEPGMDRALAMRVIPLLALGRLDEALAAQAVLDAMPEGSLPEQLLSDTALLVRLVEGSDGTESQTFREILESLRSGGMCACIGVVPVLAELGRLDEARAVLELLAKQGEGPPADAMLLNPAYAPLREDPAFVSLVDGGRDHALKGVALLEAARNRGELPPYLEAPLGRVRRVLER